MLNLTLKNKVKFEKVEIQPAMKIFLKRLRNLITEVKLSPAITPACKIKKYMAKFFKKDFISYIFAYLSSKTKYEVYRVLNKYRVNSVKKYVINK